VVNDGVGQRLGALIAEVRFAAAAEREVVDVVCAEVMQKRWRFRPGDFEMAVVGQIEQGSSVERAQILGGRIAEVKRENRAGGIDSAGLREQVVQGRCPQLGYR